MSAITIPQSDFRDRVEKLRAAMEPHQLDAVLVYGDEYRKENLRYISGYWPIFEKGALLVPKTGEPILLCAPECEQVAHEMSRWPDIRLVPNFVCVTVPEEIEYPMAKYTSFRNLAAELRKTAKLERLGIVGRDAMSTDLYGSIGESFAAELVECNHILFDLRLQKSPAEIACLEEAARIADVGYRALMDAELIGKTELEAAAVAEGAARAAGAEAIIFNVFGSGERTHTIIGRATDKIIGDGDMIMCALAVQYEGYVATCEMPFAVGNYSQETKRVIDVLVRAHNAGLPHLRAGVPMQKFVGAVKAVFRAEGLEEYDLYPPLHGIGCAEAESPYPNEGTTAVFTEGMTVNTDISLFGLPGGSNRIEEGFVITKDGPRSLSPLVGGCCENWR